MKKFLLILITYFSLFNFIHAQSITTTNATCFGVCNGSIALTPTGAAAFFQWSNGDTAQNLINLCVGTYTVTILDNGFLPIDTLTATILEPPALAFNFNTTNVSCFGGVDGSVILSATGGTQPYTYTWSNGMTTQAAFGLSAGNYAVTITDVNGCTASSFFTIVQPAPLTVALFDTAATACGACDGSIQTVITGGAAPYAYIWSDANTTQNRIGLCVGNYTLTLTDAMGCSAGSGVAITAPNNLSATEISNDIDCTHPVSNAVLTINNGTAPYYVTWGDGTQDSSMISNVLNHVYTVSTQVELFDIQYTDGSGCGNQIYDTIFNNGLFAGLTVLQQPTCTGPNIGKLLANPSNGSPPYFFLWNTGSTADSIVNLSSGTYSYTVTDSTGCTASASYYLNDTSTLTASAVGVSASCINSNVGSATIYVTGGTPGYTYLWGTVPPQTTQTATNIAPGHYGFTVTDGGGVHDSQHYQYHFHQL